MTEVQRTRDHANPSVDITVGDQQTRPFSYRSDELVPTAISDPMTSLTGNESTR